MILFTAAQAARAWLLQALTGWRASEILMLDYDPLLPIPGLDPTPNPAPNREARADTGDGAKAGDEVETTFVAKLRYQQTKVDVLSTIMVELAWST